MVFEVSTMGSFCAHPAFIMAVSIAWFSLLDTGLTCSRPSFLVRIVTTVDEQVLHIFEFFDLYPFARESVFEIF